MGALKTIGKARKNYKCERGHQIKKGEPYSKICHAFAPVRYRCKNCYPKPSELTTSDKLSRLYGVQEDLADWESKKEHNLQNLSEILDTAINEVEEVGSDYSESANNMEEYFSGSQQVDDINEKAEYCEEWRSELESFKDTVDEAVSLKNEIDTLQEDLKQYKQQKRIDQITEQINEKKQEHEEKVQEIINEIDNVSSGLQI